MKYSDLLSTLKESDLLSELTSQVDNLKTSIKDGQLTHCKEVSDIIAQLYPSLSTKRIIVLKKQEDNSYNIEATDHYVLIDESKTIYDFTAKQFMGSNSINDLKPYVFTFNRNIQQWTCKDLPELVYLDSQEALANIMNGGVTHV